MRRLRPREVYRCKQQFWRCKLHPTHVSTPNSRTWIGFAECVTTFHPIQMLDIKV
jgi:hypothetical protein